MLIDKFIVERDKYDDREDLVRQLEQKDSSISSFLQRIRGALEQIESLEDEIATGEHVSPSIQDWSAENRAIAESNVETRYLQVQDQPSPPKESLKQGDRYRPNYEKSPSVDSNTEKADTPQVIRGETMSIVEATIGGGLAALSQIAGATEDLLQTIRKPGCPDLSIHMVPTD
ncbi:MAG: hypothetical protein HETSPECPRED_005270 [Heterodermia speciosa]|uniref:Uncharacterized protein n=1 Tax=Heterodermia speciosa TaxID=116794 RepID=A0A8H3ILC3_9LECA|nr:MAG: hypothetical protein HETSPECPRED_005270 [Heterodermia speciosa]